MANPAFNNLQFRLLDAARLIDIHTETTGIAAGRRYNFDALNRAAVMLAIAAWEGFVEDLAKYAVRRLATRLESASDLPEGARHSILERIYQDHNWETLKSGNKTAMWSLTGSGWRTAYVGNATGHIRSLNTPKVENVQKLFAKLIGLRDFAEDWGATRWTRQTYVDKIEAYLTLRHRIAHGAIGIETVGKMRARDAVSVVTRIAGWTTTTVRGHINEFDLRTKAISIPSLTAALQEMERQID